ncbi:MAG TPA: hypothetical protein VIL48_03240 [Acidimicrobiales bacterium]
MTAHPARPRGVLLVGATGRLGPHVADALQRRDYEVVVAGRRGAATGAQIGGVDVADRRWWEPEAWRSAMGAAGVRPEGLAAVVNLVAPRERSRTRSEAVGTGSVRAVTAAAGANAGAHVLTVHVGSVAELCPGRRSAYASGKAAARAEALRLSVAVVLTVGVVPRRSGGRDDRLMRLIAGSAPGIAALPIATSTAEHVGEAIAFLVDTARSQVAYGPATTEVVLAGSVRRLGDVLAVDPRRWSWPRWALGLLSRTPAFGQPGLSRAASWARLAAGRPERNHYLTTASSVVPAPVWRLLQAGQDRLLLVPPGVAPG